MVCILLASRGMSFVVAVAIGMQTLLSPPPPPHLRPEIALRPLVEQAAARSPSIRALIDRLDATDVVVYVRLRPFKRSDLIGRVGLLARMPAGQRFLVIELACGRPDIELMATLGHELFHAVEIAEQPSIVDAASLIRFYTRAGEKTGDIQGEVTFETRGAERAGVQVRRELFATPTRQTWTLK